MKTVFDSDGADWEKTGDRQPMKIGMSKNRRVIFRNLSFDEIMKKARKATSKVSDHDLRLGKRDLSLVNYDLRRCPSTTDPSLSHCFTKKIIIHP